MNAALKHPTADAVLAIHSEVLAAHGGGPGVRLRALLESAVAATQASKLGAQVISDPIEIAAAYLFYLCSNHPLVDGNKRAALATCLVFLSENNLLRDETLPVDDRESLTLAVASGSISREDTTRTLRNLLA